MIYYNMHNTKQVGAYYTVPAETQDISTSSGEDQSSDEFDHSNYHTTTPPDIDVDDQDYFSIPDIEVGADLFSSDSSHHPSFTFNDNEPLSFTQVLR